MDRIAGTDRIISLKGRQPGVTTMVASADLFDRLKKAYEGNSGDAEQTHLDTMSAAEALVESLKQEDNNQ